MGMGLGTWQIDLLVYSVCGGDVNSATPVCVIKYDDAEDGDVGMLYEVSWPK